MKKLKLTALQLGASELLSREQLKNVLGGDGSGGGNLCWNQTVSCTLYVQAIGRTLDGSCGGYGTCACTANYNGQSYSTNNGGTECVAA